MLSVFGSVLYDHLDMVGVVLQATWTQTRKSNGLVDLRMADLLAINSSVKSQL